MQLIINILVSWALYLIVSLSFSIIYKTEHYFNLAHAATITLAPYFVFCFCVVWHIPFLPTIPIAVVLLVLLSLSVWFFLFKPLKGFISEGWGMMMVSLSVYVIIQSIISLLWGSGMVSFRSWGGQLGLRVFDAYITRVEIIILLVAFFSLFLLYCFGKRTHLGLMYQAMVINPEMAEMSGINLNRVIRISYFIGVFMAAIAGILIAADIDMTPTMGFDWLMYGVVAMIIGGMGKMRHLVLGALLLAAAQHLSAYFFDSKWMNATAYIILVAFLYFRPYGFSGKKLKKTEI